MADRITVTPNPPCAGKKATICYDFDGAGIEQTTLEFTWSPEEITSPASITVDDSDNCDEITIPTNATSLTIVDSDGQAADWDGTVSPVGDPECS